MASGQSCVIKETVSLQIKLYSFYWSYVFLVLDSSPVPSILGADFLSFIKMQPDFANSRYIFAFQQSCRYDCESLDFSMQDFHVFPYSEEALNELVAYTSSLSVSDLRKLDQLVLMFPKLFSDHLGTMKGMVSQLDLTDDDRFFPVFTSVHPFVCKPCVRFFRIYWRREW
jgi:hypothetical protein